MYSCLLCKRKFNYKSRYDRHMSSRKICISKEDVIKQAQLLQNLLNKQEDKMVNFQVENNTFNTTINNTNITLIFTMNDFGNETTRHLTDEELAACKRYADVARKLWCDTRCKENYNIMPIKNKPNLFKVLKGSEWVPKTWEDSFSVIEEKISNLLSKRAGTSNEPDIQRQLQQFFEFVVERNTIYSDEFDPKNDPDDQALLIKHNIKKFDKRKARPEKEEIKQIIRERETESN